MKISEYLPTGAEAKQELGNTGLMIAGATLAKVASTITGFKGLLPAGVHLAGGMLLSIFAPSTGTWSMLKPIGHGVQIYGALTAVTEASKDKLDLGFKLSSIDNPVPASIRKYLKDYVPSINGFDLKGVNEFVNNRLANLMPGSQNGAPTPMMGLSGTENLFAA